MLWEPWKPLSNMSVTVNFIDFLFVCFSFCLTLYVENMWNLLFCYCVYKKWTIDTLPCFWHPYSLKMVWGFRWLLNFLRYRLLCDMLGASFPLPLSEKRNFFKLFDLNGELTWDWGVNLSYFLRLYMFLVWDIVVMDDWKVVIVEKSNPYWKLCRLLSSGISELYSNFKIKLEYFICYWSWPPAGSL